MNQPANNIPNPDDAVKQLSQSRKSSKKRDSIIRAAIEIINDKSYALATMTEIAASLDLRDAALYYYYPNKRALVFACHLRSLDRFAQLLSDADIAGDDGISKLRNFIYTLLKDSAHNGPLLYFGDYSYLDAAQRKAIKIYADRLTTQLEQYVTEGMDDGSVVQCDTRLVVQLLLGMLIWLAKWVPGIDDITPKRLMTAIDAFSMHGLESRID